MHPHLYKRRLPRCIQDASTAVSSYNSRTPATRDMVLRIIEDRADELVTSPSEEAERDTFDHLARVQVLIAYSVIRHFDGDIRQRHLAEQHLPILDLWTSHMFESAARAAHNGTLLLSNAIEHPSLCQNTRVSSQEGQETLLWHAWILSESVRRTWLIAHFIRTIYLTLQRGSAECPGGVMVTTRRGVWGAGSAFAWTRMCAEQSVGFMHRNETIRMMVEGRPGDVDEFSLAMMEVDFGAERMERWGVEAGACC